MRLIKNNFFQQVALLSTGSSLAQLITIASSPIITRIFSPEALGVSALFFTVVGPLAIISTMSYQIAIVLPRNDSEAMKIVKLSFCLTLFFSIFFLIVWILFEKYILKIFDLELITSYLFLIPLAILGSSINSITSQWLIRKKLILLISKIAIISALISSLLKIIIGFYFPQPIVLISVSIFILYIGLILIKFYEPAELENLNIYKFSTKLFLQLFFIAKKYKDFFVYRTPQNLLNMLNHSIPIFMLTFLSGIESAGFYSLTFAVLSVPITVIAGSVYQIIYPKLNEQFLEGERIYPFLYKSLIWLSLFIFIPILIISLFGKEIFTVIFGVVWERSGIYAQWMSLALFTLFISRPIFAAIPILKIQKELLIWEVFDFILKILIFYFFYNNYHSDIKIVATLSILSAINTIVLISFVLHKSKNVRQK